MNRLFTISNNELDLRDLDAFVAVARTRNFRRAARESRVSVSSLSQRLRDMEERLGVRLVNRTTRSVALTEAGKLLLAGVGPAISDVSEALDRVRGLGNVPSGRLRINAPPPAIDLVLAPMVAPFIEAYPQIDLEIIGESSFVDIVDAGFDAGVRYGEHLAQDMIAVTLVRRSATLWWPRPTTSRGMASQGTRRICSITVASASASADARYWTGSSRRRDGRSRCHRRRN
jgi:DNA-binding transcriptional LysR family regulator